MIIFIHSFFAGALGAWVILKTGARIGVNDVPNHRSSHSRITPKGGGMGILVALLVNAFILKLPFWLWVPCLILSLVSFLGDRMEISPKLRLTIQFGCSFMFLSGGLYAGYFMAFTGLSLIPLAVFLTGSANFYNFMDGIDGIAGISGVVGFCLMGFYSHILGVFYPWGWLALGMAFSCAGFLVFNFPRARVFMGDVGSILLGFCFACMIVAVSENWVDFLVMAGFLFPFYADELFTMVLRAKKKESLLKPHRRHVYQLLANELGIPHWKISLGYGGLQILIGLSLIGAGAKGIGSVLLSFTCYGLILGGLSIWIRKKADFQPVCHRKQG